MTSDELLEQASELANLADRLELVERILENLEYASSTGDDFCIKFQIKQGVLGNLGDNVTDIKNKVIAISNKICPD
ncbi:hypothetical protein IGI37_002285 [Enterococcus sp. AZ194]|uniref:hypothetical protein n=1 Tax=Enterococcus sp. AZ194 TaxID=2774629 RepID=UPI003F29029B